MTFRSSLNKKQVMSPDNIFTFINFIRITCLSCINSKGIKQNFEKKKKTNLPSLFLISVFY